VKIFLYSVQISSVTELRKNANAVYQQGGKSDIEMKFFTPSIDMPWNGSKSCNRALVHFWELNR